MPPKMGNGGGIDSTAVSIFVVVLVELTNTVFVNSTNITTNIETAVLSRGWGAHSNSILEFFINNIFLANNIVFSLFK